MIAIINSGSNINSILFALARLNRSAILTTDEKIIQKASHVILPGVSAASIAMEELRQSLLLSLIPNLTKPVLGICLGMQLFYAFSEEGNSPCLNIVSGKVKKLKPHPIAVIPHMGWNQLDIRQSNPLFDKIESGSYVYFTHSYAAPVSNVTTAITNYNQEFSAAMQDRNFFGTQFHPEKSGKIGENILKNFLRL